MPIGSASKVESRMPTENPRVDRGTQRLDCTELSVTWRALILLLSLGIGCDTRSQSESFVVLMPALKGESKAPVAAVYADDWSCFPTHGYFGAQVIVAIWESGRIVWSEDRLKGGPSYRQSSISKRKLRSLLSDLERKGRFDDGDLKDSLFPMSMFSAIAIADGDRKLYTICPNWLPLSPTAERCGHKWNLLWRALTDLIPQDGGSVGKLEFITHDR